MNNIEKSTEAAEDKSDHKILELKLLADINALLSTAGECEC